MRHFVVFGLLPLVILGCGATVPRYEVWRPWTRVLGEGQAVPIGQSIQIRVEGTTDPMPGHEELLQDQLASIAGELLARRGYQIVESNPDLMLTLRYRTERVEEFAAAASASVTAETASSVGMRFRSASVSDVGLGVAVASAVVQRLTRTSSSAAVAIETTTGFVHTIELALAPPRQQPVWTGESRWQTEDVEIVPGVKDALRLILSRLPSDSALIPAVPALRDSHIKNFLDAYCGETPYSCPALPYRIFLRFVWPPQYVQDGMGSYGFRASELLLDPAALPAYLDLAQTAEFALPIGKGNYSKPLDLNLWKEVMLGGRYRLGPDSQLVNVLLELEGRAEGYDVKKAWLASDSEFAEFRDRLRRWQEVLRVFFDMYED